jgi:hypothetical protein
MTLGYSTVRLNVTALVIDGVDTDDLPDEATLSGTITLSPMIQTGRTIQYDDGGVLKLKALTEMEVDIGATGDISHRNRDYVKVVAPTVATTNTEELQYKATFKNLKVGTRSINIDPIYFYAVPDVVINLAEHVNVAPNSTATQLSRGPRGFGVGEVIDEAGNFVFLLDDADATEIGRVPIPEGVVTDGAVADLVTPGTATKAALDGTYAPGSVATSKLDKTEAASTYARMPGGVVRNALTGCWHVAGADPTGATDNTALINSYLAAAKAAGGGIVRLPEGIFQAEPTVRHRCRLAGVTPQITKLNGVPGSSRPGVVQFEAGYNQYTWIQDLSISSPNAGQHGVYAYATGIAPDNNGGWWQGGMRNVTIGSLTGAADCIRFDSAANPNNLLPHQFLEFHNVFCFAPSGGRAITALSQCGQFTFIGGQYDGYGLTQTGTNIFVSGGKAYSWTFHGTTFQQAAIAVSLSAVVAFAFMSCYWENCGTSLLANAGSQALLVEPRFANAGYVADGSGCLVKATNTSFVNIVGGTVGGQYNRMFIEDTPSKIDARGFRPPAGAYLVSQGATKQVAISSTDGSVTLTRGTKIALVNASATVLQKISAELVPMPGDELVLMAFGGSITLSNANADGVTNISLAPVTSASTLVIPDRATVTLRRMDAVYGWVVTSVSRTL